MFEVTILKVTPKLSQNEFNALLDLVSPEKQERIKKFYFKQDAINCLLGDILARSEICRVSDTRMEEIEFVFNKYGKPFIVDNSHIHFNITHAGCYVACAIADESVGIDIEIIQNANMKIAKRFFTQDETAYIIEGNQHDDRFYEVWTKKESVIKWQGIGLHKPLSSFSVCESSNQERLFLHKVFHTNHAICHVCSTRATPPSVKIMDAQVLINSLLKG